MRPSSTKIRLVAGIILFIAFAAPLVSGGTFANAPVLPLIHHQDISFESLTLSGIVPWKPRPVLGPQKTLVLPVQFGDVRLRSSISEITSLVAHVDDWFRQSSYGKMYIDYTIYEQVITLPNTMSSYGAPMAEKQRGDDQSRADNYIVDTLNTIITETTVDLSEYKHVVLIHAGGDEADSGNPNEIWSYCDCVGPIADEDPRNETSWVVYDESGRITHAFWGISTFSEEEHWAVFVHEFTHSLGVSDLYMYGPDGYSEGPGVGFWSNMATGAMLDPPVDIDGWSKYILGWIEAPVVAPSQGEYTVYTLDSAGDPKALLVPINGTEDEYYFIHARRKTGTDAALPSEGIIVFSINRLRERSLAGEELAVISDANPDTPLECYGYSGMARELCWPLDAPYNAIGREYTFSYYAMSANLVLNDEGFWDENARIAFKVQPIDADSFKISFGTSPEQVGITATTTSTTIEPEPTGCLVATAAFGSEMAPEVTYMRFVRDGMIGSTQTGRRLVETFNAFYYSWSPAAARAIGGSEVLRTLSLVLLIPLIEIVHVTALSFTIIVHLTGSAQTASLVSFLLAANASVICYIVFPFLFALRMLHVFKRWRGRDLA